MRLLLLLVLITYCLTYDCSNDFNNIKTSLCTNINSCLFYGPSCKATKPCSEGASSEYDCSNIIPLDFIKYKCVYDDDEENKCVQRKRECDDYNTKPRPWRYMYKFISWS